MPRFPKHLILLLVFFSCLNCSQNPKVNSDFSLKLNKSVYQYQELEALYSLHRSFSQRGASVYFQSVIREKNKSELEDIKLKNSMSENRQLIPHSSRFETWLEKEKVYFETKWDPGKKLLKVMGSEYEGREMELTEINGYDAGIPVCFFSVILECALGQMMKTKKPEVAIIFDNYPWIVEREPSLEPLVMGQIFFINQDEDGYKFEIRIETAGEENLFHYKLDKSHQLISFAWIKFGISYNLKPES